VQTQRSGTAIGNNEFNFDVVVNVSGAITAAEARLIGTQIATSAEQQLLQRRVVAQVRAVS